MAQIELSVPVGLSIESTSPHELKLVDITLMEGAPNIG
jgi:hypothetical protein